MESAKDDGVEASEAMESSISMSSASGRSVGGGDREEAVESSIVERYIC